MTIDHATLIRLAEAVTTADGDYFTDAPECAAAVATLQDAIHALSNYLCEHHHDSPTMDRPDFVKEYATHLRATGIEVDDDALAEQIADMDELSYRELVDDTGLAVPAASTDPIEAVLEQHDGLCLDNAEERATLAIALRAIA